MNEEGAFMKTILVEGMDCAGKSAAIDLLEERKLIVGRRHRVLSKNNFLVDAFRKAKEHHEWDSDEVTEALLSAVSYDLKHQEPHNGKGIFIQESILAVKGFAMLKANSQLSKEFTLEFSRLIRNYPQFDKVLFLTVDKHTRQERIKRRINKTGWASENDRMILDNFEKFDEINDEMCYLMQEFFQAETIDTSLMSTEEVAERIIEVSKWSVAHVLGGTF